MPDQQVPWAPGRRALIRFSVIPGDANNVTGWRVAIGVLEDLAVELGRHAPIWVLDPSNAVDPVPVACVLDYQRLSSMEHVRDSAVIATALVPGQCPRCFESTRPHAPGCMVAANLARGVPEFWAPWAMWKDPAELPVGIRLFHLDPENPPNGGFYLCDVVAVIPGRASRLALVAIGPEGPTLAPWGTP